MPRYRLTIEYNGAQFSGWQRQENAPSVQEALEEAFNVIEKEGIKSLIGNDTGSPV